MNLSNIFNHNNALIDFILSGEDYWDFHLSTDVGYEGASEGLSEKCLSAYIDFNDPNCIFWNDIVSKENYVWEEAINDGVSLNFIGMTGIDNGLITYQKDRINNDEFLDLFFNSKYEIEKNDVRLRLKKINGNNQIYDYSNDIVHLEGKDVARLNGGFYQGFFKVYEKKYQVLPFLLNNGWSMEIRLMKSNLENKELTINDTHPKNKGIFLYIGTRAENKWWDRYKVDDSIEALNLEYVDSDYVEDGYTTENVDTNSRYFGENDKDYLESIYSEDEDCKTSTVNIQSFIDNEYVHSEYFNPNINKEECYVEDDYIRKEKEITGDEKIETADGMDFNQPNVVKYETDNKFILFDHTKEGFNIGNWEEGSIVTIYDIKKPNIGNYYTLFNHTPKGYTINEINAIIEAENKKYDVSSDLYRNALAFQIRDDGSIGFKYLVRNCEDDNEDKYRIEEFFSNSNVIDNDKWHTVSIKIVPNTIMVYSNQCCDNITTPSARKMTIYIYVDGQLKLKSDELPILNLKPLNDLSDKQQGVPFSLSLGGGTQGLCDTVGINYRELPKYKLPLEKEFCGSFIGYIEKFRFYSCPLNFNEISENFKSDCNN